MGLGVPRGGFVGVDVFFVISGYLIARNILAELATGRFSFLRFYERRARRIIPALFCMLVVCAPIVAVTYPREPALDNLAIVTAAALSASNLLIAASPGLDYSAGMLPFLHTWSLGVEEQFYMLFPLVLFAVFRFRPAATPAALAAIAVISFTAAVIATRRYHGSDYFLPHLRAWELMMGSLVAATEGRLRITRSQGNMFAGLGLVLLLAGIFLLRSRYANFPGPAALLPTAGTALVILCAVEGSAVRRWLGHSSLVGVGLISYSLYLWHWPVFEIFRQVSGTGFRLGYGWSVALTALSVALAYLSWRFVERPFRRPPTLRSSSELTAYVAIPTLGLAAAALSLSGLTVH